MSTLTQIILGLVFSLLGLFIGLFFTEIYVVTKTFPLLVAAILGMILGNMLGKAWQRKPKEWDFIFGLTLSTSFGLMVGLGALCNSYKPLLALLFAGTYYAFFSLALGARYARYKWFR